jgi:hypothetical protein
MKRLRLMVCTLFALMLALAAGGDAATKSYQFTGTVKTVDSSTMTVEKSAKETWTFEISKDTKGVPKVGDRVTVNYKMVATDVEAKPATPTKTKPKKP